MELLVIGVILALLLTLSTGLPIAFTLFGLAALFDLLVLGPKSLYLAYSAIFSNMSQELYIAVPLFVLMAMVLEISGIAGDLYEVMYKWMAGLRGGLAIGTCWISALIDAMSGLGATATLTMGVLALPEMRKRGYHKDIALGCIPPSGALGPLIPPSVVMIILGGLTGLSIGKLFMGGFLPGLLITALFAAYIAIRCYFQPHLAPAIPKEERGSWLERILALRGVILPLLLVILVLGSIYTGAATPTEAAGVGAMGTTLIALFRKRLGWEKLNMALTATMKINAMVLWLLIGGTAFSVFLNSVGLSRTIVGLFTGLGLPAIAVVWIMLVIALIMGCFVDGASVLMITTPVFFPVIRALGMNELWFGIVFTISIVIGYVTPPFGMNLFYLKGVAPRDVSMADIIVAVQPFTVLMIIGLILSVHFPEIPLLLPNLMK